MPTPKDESNAGVPCPQPAEVQSAPFDLVIFDLDGTLVVAPRGRGRHVRIPGSHGALADLRRAGARLALASMCGRGFMDDGLGRLGLGAEVDAARCLADPGCRTKAAMVADLLLQFGTRSSIFVGDSGGDAGAARDNGLPFIHFLGSGSHAASIPEVDARTERLAAIPAILARRPQRLLELWTELDEPAGLAIVGPSGTGAELVARDMVRALGDAGVLARAIHRGALYGEQPLAAECEALGGALSREGVTLAFGPGAADDWPAGKLDRVVALESSEAGRHLRVRAACAVNGPPAERDGLDRSDAESRHVRRSLAQRGPDRRVGAEAPLSLPSIEDA